jgi:hypothetical protein
VAEKGGDILGLDAQHGLPAKLLIERLQDGRRAEHDVSGVLHLGEAPVVALCEHIEHRTALPGIAVENAVQTIGREIVGQLLGAQKVVDACKGVVRQRKIDAFGSGFAGLGISTTI